MSDESKFTDKEIEQQRRQATSKRANVDHEKLQRDRDLILAARTDTPEEFQTRMTNRGVNLNSDQGRKIMEAFWAIRRGL